MHFRKVLGFKLDIISMCLNIELGTFHKIESDKVTLYF